MTSTYKDDLIRSQELVRGIAKNFKNDDWGVSNSSKKAAYNIKITKGDKSYTLKIKDERRYANSPNICIEMFIGRTGKASGIYLCSADTTIHCFGKSCVVYNTKAMLKFLEQNIRDRNLFCSRFRNGDDCSEGVTPNINMLVTCGVAEVIDMENLVDYFNSKDE